MKINDLKRIKADMLYADIKIKDLHTKTDHMGKTTAYQCMKKDADISLKSCKKLVKALTELGMIRDDAYWTEVFIGKWDK